MIICLIKTTLTEEGLITRCKEIQVKETEKCYVTDSGKRIKKDMI